MYPFAFRGYKIITAGVRLYPAYGADAGLNVRILLMMTVLRQGNAKPITKKWKVTFLRGLIKARVSNFFYGVVVGGAKF